MCQQGGTVPKELSASWGLCSRHQLQRPESIHTCMGCEVERLNLAQAELRLRVKSDKRPEGAEWIGKWVRYYSAGRLVIGCVDYVSKNWHQDEELRTDGGVVNADRLEEWR